MSAIESLTSGSAILVGVDRVRSSSLLVSDAEFIYGMLIHSCYVDDGNGNKVQLVDDRGLANFILSAM